MRMTLEQLEAQASAEYGGPAIGAWPRRPGERLRPHKGGDGGAGDARAMEEERQARIKKATASINNIFNTGNRDALYTDQRGAVYDLNSQDVNRQAAEAERMNRFGLARAGLLGGSADIDSMADINRRTNEGLIRAGGIADQASADLRASDEQTRANLISLAQSGIDTGTASQMALQGLKANAANAAGARGGATVGSLFNDMAQAYLYNQQQQGRASGGGQYGSQWYGVSSPTQRYSGA